MITIIKFLLKFLKIIIDEIYSDSGTFIFFGIIFALILVIINPYLLDVINWLLIPNNYEILYESLKIKEKQKAQEIHNQFIRNAGWALWLVLSLSGLTYGLYLATRGRKTQEKQWKTQHDSHLHDRYEKAAHMLGSEIMAVRVAGCQALRSLAIDDVKMKEQCVSLLFSFIRNPYLDDDDKKKIPTEYEYEYESIDKYEDEKFNDVFPILISLRDDIQEAADSFSAIYEKYGDAGIDIEKVKLPRYFLKNKTKNPISLIKAVLMDLNAKGANLWLANLQEASIWEANLEGANLQHANLKKAGLYFANLQEARLGYANLKEAGMCGVNLQKANLCNAKFNNANLKDAIFSGADISGAYMRDAEDLTKEQILSAIWGYDEEWYRGHPILPEELLDDPEVQEWLATPHYNREKKEGD